MGEKINVGIGTSKEEDGYIAAKQVKGQTV